MPTPIYTSPFTGTVVTPTDVSYSSLSFGVDTPLFWPSIVNQGTGETPATRIIDCTATAAGLAIQLPQANQGTVGADILFRNLGSNSFIVEDYTGANSVLIDVGISKYFYLSDNTTSAGTWGNVTFGAGTSSADAATLAGAGLTTVNGQLATTQNIVTVSVAPTISNASRAATFNWEGGAGNIALPAVSTLSNGWFIAFRNNGTGTLSFTPQSPQTINGSSSISTNPGDSGFIFYDVSGAKYITVGWITPSNVIFTSATYDVDSIVGNTLSLVSNAPIIQTYVAQSGTRTATLAVTLPAITQLYVINNSTGQSGYNITLQNQGSSQTPLIVSTGSIYTILSNGLNLFILNSSSSATFKAVNGTASAPSFSFLNDTSTGAFLVGTGVLGLSANGVKLVDINGTNLSAPVVTVSAQLNASLISGGTF